MTATNANELTTMLVDGEEDLPTLPEVALAPDGAAGIVYGQPGEGMLLIRVDERAQEAVGTLLEAMDGSRSFWVPRGRASHVQF